MASFDRIFKLVVIATGLGNVFLGFLAIFLHKSIAALLASSEPFVMLFGGFAAFSGVLLVWAAGNVKERGTVILADAVLRLFAGGVFLILNGLPNAAIAGVLDAAVGGFYILGLALDRRR